MADAGAKDVTTPAPALDRGALERVLARAAELGVQSSDIRDTTDAITEAQLIEIGKEVGLAPSALQQALAEERTRVVLVEETGSIARVTGPAAVSATRVITQTPESVLAALEEWIRGEYRMIAKRRFGNRRTWEPRSGVFAELERGLRGNQAAAALMGATEVAATVSPIGDGRTVVRLDADLSAQRSKRRTAAMVIGAMGVLLGGVPIVLGSVLAPLSMLPLFVGFGALPPLAMTAAAWGTLKGHRAQAERAQLGLEQLLDRLEHATMPRGLGQGNTPPLLSETVAAVARGVREVARVVEDAASAKRGAR
jgi:hypothetical protein